MPFRMSSWLQTTLADFFMRGVDYSFGDTVYVGLFTSFNEPSDGNSYTEVSTSGTSYTRKAVAFDPPVNGATANSADVFFPLVTAPYGTVTHVGVFDSLTGGNLLCWGVVSTPRTPSVGTQLKFDAGEFDVSIIANPSVSVADDIINMTLRNVPRSPPGAQYVALLTSFTDDFTYSESTDPNYVRQAASFSPPSDGTTSNSGSVIFPAADGTVTYTHMAVFDSEFGGQMIVRGPLPSPKLLVVTQQFKVDPGNLEVVFD